MKWIIASDLHGSAHYCRRLLEAWKREEAPRMLFLGDLLYHGPRNDLPEGYAPKEVIALLQERQAEVAAAISRLSREEQLLFYRKYYYLQSTAQIAAELGTTQRSVEGRLYRLKKKLRALLGGEGYD